MPANLFERVGRERPPVEATRKQPHKIQRAQRLLDWMQSWTKPTISARDICIYGPRPIRKREKAGEAAEVLVKTGWLRPIPTHRSDMEAWLIIRQPLVYPQCSRVAD
jgi:hypothetical protein